MDRPSRTEELDEWMPLEKLDRASSPWEIVDENPKRTGRQDAGPAADDVDDVAALQDYSMPGSYPDMAVKDIHQAAAATTSASKQHRHTFDASEAESFEPLFTLLPDSPDFDEIMDELAMPLYAQEGASSATTAAKPLTKISAAASSLSGPMTSAFSKASPSDIPSAWSEYVQNAQYNSQQEPSKIIATAYAVDTMPGTFPNIDYNALDYDNLGQMSGLIDSAASPGTGHDTPSLVIGPIITSLMILWMLGRF